jgi:sensor histidine kinase regulating citrate/malate metabolism
VAVPLELGVGRRVIGVLNAYRGQPGPWSAQQIELLRSLADHAAIAIQTAQLLEDSRRQVRGLSLLVRSLRTQSHEHANLIHAVSGLLALGDAEAAQGLMRDADARFQSADSSISHGIENSVVSGFLLAETVIAGNGGIELVTDRESSLDTLPAALSELDAITILGNLIRNAVEAVSGPDAAQRRVLVRIVDGPAELEIRVTDWGSGIAPAQVDRLFETGYSTKEDHVGLGLPLVRGIVMRARGQIAVEHPHDAGTTFVVRIPSR